MTALLQTAAQAGPPRPLLAVAVAVAIALSLLLALRFQMEARRVKLPAVAAWRDLAGTFAMNSALVTVGALVATGVGIVFGRLGVPGGYWFAFAALLVLDVALVGVYRSVGRFVGAIQKARHFGAVETERDAARAEVDSLAAVLLTAEVHLPVVYLRSLAEGIVDDVSDEFAEMVGTTARALRGTPYVSHIHPDDAARTAEVVGDVLEREGPMVADFRNRWRHAETGAEVWIEWGQLTADGRLWRARDVTDEVRRDALLAEAEKDLEDLRPVLEAKIRGRA